MEMVRDAGHCTAVSRPLINLWIMGRPLGKTVLRCRRAETWWICVCSSRSQCCAHSSVSHVNILDIWLQFDRLRAGYLVHNVRGLTVEQELFFLFIYWYSEFPCAGATIRFNDFVTRTFLGPWFMAFVVKRTPLLACENCISAVSIRFDSIYFYLFS